jgi:hypothetical protein
LVGSARLDTMTPPDGTAGSAVAATVMGLSTL